MKHILWKDEVENIKGLLLQGIPLELIGKSYGVSKQRMYQVLTKFGLSTPLRERKSFLREKEPKYYWLNKMLTKKNVPKKDRILLLESLNIPDVCPMLGMSLNYNGTGREGWSRHDNSPSLDRIDSSLGYIKDNLQIISWRANRIKNDGTPEELMQIAKYMKRLTRNMLQV